MDQVVKILLLDYKLCRYSIIPTPTPMSFTQRGGGRQYSWTHSPRSFRQGGNNQVATYLGQLLQVPGRVIPVPKTNASFFKLKLENCKKKMPLILIEMSLPTYLPIDLPQSVLVCLRSMWHNFSSPKDGFLVGQVKNFLIEICISSIALSVRRSPI